MDHLLYGARHAQALNVVDAVSPLLMAPLQMRESDYMGVYWISRSPGANVKVVSQPDPEGECLEDDFADFVTLVYVDQAENFVELDGISIGSDNLRLLRRS